MIRSPAIASEYAVGTSTAVRGDHVRPSVEASSFVVVSSPVAGATSSTIRNPVEVAVTSVTYVLSSIGSDTFCHDPSSLRTRASCWCSAAGSVMPNSLHGCVDNTVGWQFDPLAARTPLAVTLGSFALQAE